MKGISHLRLLTLAVFAGSLFSANSAAAQSYKLQPDITSIPAASNDTSIHAGVQGDTSATLDFSVCFFTGYGSTAPIVPSSFTPSSTGAGAAVFTVPASSIQEIPPSAFTNGVFSAMLYTVPTSTTVCEGWGQTPSSGITIPINFPVLDSISLSSVVRQNSNLTTRLPGRISLFGANFLGQTETTSTVLFTATGSFPGNVSYINSTALSSSIPAELAGNSSLAAVRVCNTAVYSYCSATISLPINPLEANYGSLTASPSTTQPQQPIGLSATFSPGKRSTAGAPGGLVTFEDAGTTLGSRPLRLDLSATYALAPPANFNTGSTLLAPLVADLNQDGVPDVVFIEPGAPGSNTLPVIHILQGASPVGQFGPDIPYSGFGNNPCGKLLNAAISDFNGDGYPDLALLCQNTSTAGAVSETVYILLNESNGTFSPVSSSYGPVYGANLVAADFNHDGKADLVVAGALDASGDSGLQVLIGKGDGTFTAGPSSSGLDTAPSASFSGFQIAVADLNNDGFPDIAILNGTSSSGSVDKFIQFFQNDGTGVFTRAASTVPTDGTASAKFFLAPLQPGQPQDIIVVSFDSSRGGITTFPSLGGADIAFSSSSQFTAEGGLLQAVVGDFNGDGFLDVGVTNGSYLYVLMGDGTGVFKKDYLALCVLYPSGLTLVAAADENADGYADLLTINSSAPDSTGASTTSLVDYVISGTASATLTLPSLASGVHRIIASTLGTPEIEGTSAEATVVITGGGSGSGSTTSIAASVDSPQSFGAPITLYGSVLDPAATGTLSFYSNGTLFGTAMLSTPPAAGYASGSITLNPLNAGTYSFEVVYSGDATHATATSAILPFTINPIAPVVIWVPDHTGISFGAPLSAGELDAVASGLAGVNVPGNFTYIPALGTVLASGTHTLSVTFTPSSTNYVSATAAASITIIPAVPAIVWSPNPQTISFGTALSPAQLDAYADTPFVASVAGTFVYIPALGTVLPVGTHTVLVAFAPTDSLDYKVTTSAVNIIVGKVNPILTWPTPADAVIGTVLSSAQLDATAAGVSGAPLPGAFTYTPPAGTVLTSGTQQLSVLFVPTDTADYNSASASVSINVLPEVLSSLLPNTGSLGDPATTVTLTGTGFLSTSVVQMNGAAVPTTFVSSTSLTAIVPAAQLKTVQAIQVAVYDPVQNATSNALPFTVTAPSTTVQFNAPTSITPASQNTVTFLLAPYPADVDATFTLAFQPASGLTNDPMIVFASSGERTATVHVDAHADTVSVPVSFESGTVAGTLTLTVSLIAGGANVTPSIQPIIIQEPFAVPGLSSVVFSQSGNVLTVVARGYSNTRAVSAAKFHFTAAPNQTVNTPELILSVTPLFSTWYTDFDSQQYGSEFTYTETFNLDSDAAAVGQVSLTLTNDSGTSQEANTP